MTVDVPTRWAEDPMRPDFVAEEFQAKHMRDYKAMNDLVEKVIEWAHTDEGKKWYASRPKKGETK